MFKRSKGLMGTTPAGMLSFLHKATAEAKVVEDATKAYCGSSSVPALAGAGTRVRILVSLEQRPL